MAKFNYLVVLDNETGFQPIFYSQTVDFPNELTRLLDRFKPTAVEKLEDDKLTVLMGNGKVVNWDAVAEEKLLALKNLLERYEGRVVMDQDVSFKKDTDYLLALESDEIRTINLKESRKSGMTMYHCPLISN